MHRRLQNVRSPQGVHVHRQTWSYVLTANPCRCILLQLIALRYGTVPVVRETGGLADTVCDVAHGAKPEHCRNGFTFQQPDVPAAEKAIHRAIDAYR